jgi:hypothetical protein
MRYKIAEEANSKGLPNIIGSIPDDHERIVEKIVINGKEVVKVEHRDPYRRPHIFVFLDEVAFHYHGCPDDRCGPLNWDAAEEIISTFRFVAK